MINIRSLLLFVMTSSILVACGSQAPTTSIFTSTINIRNDGSGTLTWVFSIPLSQSVCQADSPNGYLKEWNYKFEAKTRSKYCDITASFKFKDIKMLEDQIKYVSKGRPGTENPRQILIQQKNNNIILTINVKPTTDTKVTQAESVWIITMPRIDNYTNNEYATFDKGKNEVRWLFPLDVTQTVEIEGGL